MKVYLDLIFFLNIGLDFLLLFSLNTLLKRNTSIKRIILGSIVGGLSIFFLFLPSSSNVLFLLKLLISIIMILVTFSFRNIKTFLYNLFYLYLLSILLGGFLYFFKVELSYKNNGLLFSYHDSYFPFILLLFISPFFIYFYLKEQKKYKNTYSKIYEVDLYWNNSKYYFTAFLDTGNRLKDPYKKRPVILVFTDKITPPLEKTFLVPYHTASHHDLLKCTVVDKIIINKQEEITKPVIGFVQEDFDLEGVNMILNNETLGG